MKLKNLLLVIFLVLTIIPIAIISLLLYRSGYELSKESYTRNLAESITVQVDYISQTIENNMIADYHFASQNISSNLTSANSSTAQKSDLYSAVAAYLSAAEDKLTVCMLLDQQNQTLYTIGEKGMVDIIGAQLPKPSEMSKQAIIEFNLGDGSHSLGIVTPVWEQDTYAGCLVSVFDKTYLFKTISSYYEIANTSTYICRNNGDIINSRQHSDENSGATVQALHEFNFATDGAIAASIGSTHLSGYYQNIGNTPWYLVGFVDDALVYAFANQFIPVYSLFILVVLLLDIIMAFYISRKVVRPLHNLIKIMEGCQNNINSTVLQCEEENGYYETKYLHAKFLDLMREIMLIQHNFEGIYQLYQSSDMGDTNIAIDVANQTITSNKEVFQKLLDEVAIPQGACIVEKLTHCFCEKDQKFLMELLQGMRDEHLSVVREAEVYTPYLDHKWFHTLIVPMYTNDKLSRLFVQLRDISSFKIQELESSEQVKRDSLTGLYNRTGFISCVNQSLKLASDTALHALIFIDMDYFKSVNDNFGHNAGDTLLRTVANTLLDVTSENDVVSRFGGDEFAVFVSRTSADEIAKMELVLKNRLLYPFHTEQISFVVSASIGISTWQHGSASTLEDLLQQADATMYKAKREFKEGKKNSSSVHTHQSYGI